MLALACILTCDRCDAATARVERGWRAYFTPHQGDESAVSILCPAYAERRAGEDETPWSP